MDELLSQVTRLIRRHLPAEYAPLLSNPDTELASVGFESLRVAAFLADVERQLSIAFPAELIDRETFYSARTISAAIATLRRPE